MGLKREMGASGILFASISAIIGSGWLFGSLYAAQMAGPAAILAWIAGGIAVIFLALCFAELATMFPLPGGLGIFPIFSHGATTSYVVSWVAWLAFIVIAPIEVQAVIQYSGNYIPGLITKVDGIQHLTWMGFSVAIALLLSLAVVNSISVKFMSDTNFFVTIWKLLIPIAAIVLFFMHSSNVEKLTNFGGFAPYGAHGVFASLAVGGIVLAFNGFQPGIALAGETKNPQRNIPLAVIGSVIICMAIYCLLQLSFLLAVPVDHLSKGWENLSFTGEAGPLAGLAILLGVGWLAKLLYVDALVSPMGTAVVFFAASARASYSMSQYRYLPAFFQKTTRQGVPLWGVIANFVIAVIVFLTFHGWQEMAAFYAAAICFCNSFIPLTLVTLRRTLPNVQRSFVLPSYKIMSFIAFYISSMMYFWCGWDIIQKFNTAVLVGVVFFVLSNLLKKEKSILPQFRYSLVLFTYLVAFSVISKLGSYGGGMNYLTSGTDYIVIGAVCVAMFIFAQKLSLSASVAEKSSREALSALPRKSKAA